MGPEQELQALRAASGRARCRVDVAGVGPTPAGRHAVGRVVCPDGWAAARLLTALSESDAERPDVQQLALMLRASAPLDADFARALHAFVKRTVRFEREKGEVFTGATVTIALGFGDCDDHARLLYALARAGGLPVRMAFLHKPMATGPSHAVTQLGVDGHWWWAETTIDALFGEQPYDAGKRLGLLGERPDISTEVVTMTDRDLPPAPKSLVSSAEQIERDASALARLGFICDEVASEIRAPDDPRFRAAVAEFQRRQGTLTIDGLIGPKTRAALAAELPPDEFGIGYLASIGQATGRTAHLSPEFFRNVEAMADRFRERGADVTAIDFLNVWLYESGIGRAKQGHGGLPYYGLNMMHVSNLPGVGWTGSPEAYRDLDPADQVHYVARFYESLVPSFLAGDWRKMNTATVLYLMNFLPKFSEHGDEPGFVLTRRGDATRWYESNPSFDPEGKGYIEVADLTRALERARRENAAYWAEVVARAQTEGGTVAPSGIGRLAGLAAGTTIVVVAAGLLAAVLTHGGDKAAVRSELRARVGELARLPSKALSAVRR